MLKHLDSHELTEWMALGIIRGEEQADQRREQELLSRLKATMAKGRR